MKAYAYLKRLPEFIKQLIDNTVRVIGIYACGDSYGGAIPLAGKASYLSVKQEPRYVAVMCFQPESIKTKILREGIFNHLLRIPEGSQDAVHKARRRKTSCSRRDP